MNDALKIINDVAVYLLLALVGFLTWFFKNIFSEHKKMYDFYSRNKEVDINKVFVEIESLKHEIKKVELESKKYWFEHKSQMDSNQKVLLEKISSFKDASEQQTALIKELFNSLENRLERLEDRVNRK